MAALTEKVCKSILLHVDRTSDSLTCDPLQLNGADENIMAIRDLILNEARSNAIPMFFSRMPLNLTDEEAYKMALQVYLVQANEYYYSQRDNKRSSEKESEEKEETNVILPERVIVCANFKESRKVAEFVQTPNGSFALVAKYYLDFLNPQGYFIDSINGGFSKGRPVKCITKKDWVVSPYGGKVFYAVEGIDYSALGFKRIDGICGNILGCSYVFPHHEDFANCYLPYEVVTSVFDDRPDLPLYYR